MKARLPEGYSSSPGNVNKLMKQAQQAQADMAALQEDLDTREYTAGVQGGIVSATVNGKHRVLSVTIDPELLADGDAEMVGDLAAAAVNEAIDKAMKEAEVEMEQISGALNIPGF